MREIVNLFRERESRDELGIGQVRDAMSDSLWPGTSTLFTRARYFVFIPWCFRAAAEARNDADKATTLADQYERRLIGALTAAGERGCAWCECWCGAEEFAVRFVLGRDAYPRHLERPNTEPGRCHRRRA